MMVLSADHQIDLESRKRLANRSRLPEKRIQSLRRLRNRRNAAVWKSVRLGHIHRRGPGRAEIIVFEAGSHTDAIKMSYRDYEKIVRCACKTWPSNFTR